ncbi:MAG: hypothetical protein ACQEXJ_17830 [Myxococcota bacterium]
MSTLVVRLQRLRSEIASDRRAFERQVDALRTLDLTVPDSPELAAAAVALHHAYGAVEAILSRVSQTLEGEIPSGPDWHVALLRGMTLDIESVRPALLEQETADLAHMLLGFRHFFRHAYAVALDGRRLEDLREDAERLKPLLVRDLERFDAHLRQVIELAGDTE